jgi:mycothione reductase
LPDEEPEISELLKEEMMNRMEIYTNHEAVEAAEKNGVKTVVARSRKNGQTRQFSAEALLVAAGRVPNSDLLKTEKTGVELDNRGYVKVNEYLETGKKNIWAFGDAIGKQMFKHVANYEAEIAWHNAVHDHKEKVDYSAAPHAVFTHPQIGSIGLKEAEAKQQGYKILVGTSLYKDTALGAAMGEPKGFVKVILEQKTGKLLGGYKKSSTPWLQATKPSCQSFEQCTFTLPCLRLFKKRFLTYMKLNLQFQAKSLYHAYAHTSTMNWHVKKNE